MEDSTAGSTLAGERLKQRDRCRPVPLTRARARDRQRHLMLERAVGHRGAPLHDARHCGCAAQLLERCIRQSEARTVDGRVEPTPYLGVRHADREGHAEFQTPSCGPPCSGREWQSLPLRRKSLTEPAPPAVSGSACITRTKRSAAASGPPGVVLISLRFAP